MAWGWGGWPEPVEFDKITILRNNESIRNYFLDNKVLDVVQNRKWLENGMRKPKEALLSIRLKANQCFLGTIGWSDWDVKMKTACFGRFMVDHDRITKIKDILPEAYIGIALDASFALRDFAMCEMNIEFLRTYLFVNNIRAKNVNVTIGLEEVNRSTLERADGTKVDTIEMLLTKSRWKQLTQL